MRTAMVLGIHLAVAHCPASLDDPKARGAVDGPEDLNLAFVALDAHGGRLLRLAVVLRGVEVHAHGCRGHRVGLVFARWRALGEFQEHGRHLIGAGAWFRRHDRAGDFGCDALRCGHGVVHRLEDPGESVDA